MEAEKCRKRTKTIKIGHFENHYLKSDVGGCYQQLLAGGVAHLLLVMWQAWKLLPSRMISCIKRKRVSNNFYSSFFVFQLIIKQLYDITSVLRIL